MFAIMIRMTEIGLGIVIRVTFERRDPCPINNILLINASKYFEKKKLWCETKRKKK